MRPGTGAVWILKEPLVPLYFCSDCLQGHRNYLSFGSVDVVPSAELASYWSYKVISGFLFMIILLTIQDI